MKEPFAPGFRLSVLDVVVLVAGGAGAGLLLFAGWFPAGIVVAMVVGHFFLFCNVFRISRGAELTWAGLFVLLAGAKAVWDIPGWWAVAGISIGAAALLIFRETRKPRYHGIFWKKWNPDLESWWRERNQPGKTDHETT